MQSLEVSCAVRPIHGSLGAKGLKSGSLNLLEPSGPVKACNGIALSLQNVHHINSPLSLVCFLPSFHYGMNIHSQHCFLRKNGFILSFTILQTLRWLIYGYLWP
jgi:hypothetical protein